MKEIYRIVETRDSWLFENIRCGFLTETNMFGGRELVELPKEDFGFDLKAAEYVEKTYNVEVWKDFPTDEDIAAGEIFGGGR